MKIHPGPIPSVPPRVQSVTQGCRLTPRSRGHLSSPLWCPLPPSLAFLFSKLPPQGLGINSRLSLEGSVPQDSQAGSFFSEFSVQASLLLRASPPPPASHRLTGSPSHHSALFILNFFKPSGIFLFIYLFIGMLLPVFLPPCPTRQLHEVRESCLFVHLCISILENSD